jgi:YHS domain-containing protein
MEQSDYLENVYHIEQMPIVKKLIKQNEKLKKKNKELKKLVKLITNNVSLLTLENLNNSMCNCKSSKLPKLIRKKVLVKQEVDLSTINTVLTDDDVVILPTPEKNNIVYEIVSDDGVEVEAEEEEAEEEEAEAEEAEEEAEEEEAEEEEAEEEEAEEEEAAEEEAEEEEAEEEEAAEEEAEEEEAAEEEVEEEEAAEDEAAEEEVAEEEAAEEEVEEEEAEVYEVNINGKTYYTSNEVNGIIYGVDEDGDVSLEVGKYVNGKIVFY